MDTNFQPIISTNVRGHYRQHPLEFKRALVVLSLEPGASVARIAREHGVNANQVFSWRRLYQQGRLGVPTSLRDDGLLPVVRAPTAPAPSNTSSDVDSIIVLELGEVRVRILLAKRIERGRFVWPQASSGSVALTQVQLSMLLEGIEWRRPERTWKPTSAL